MNDLKKYFRIIIVWQFFTISSISCSCNTVPISLSNLQLCTNGVCSYTEVANSIIDATPGSTACFEFISPDPNISPFFINVSVIDTYFHFESDYCYFTDVVSMDYKGFCHCPGSLSGGTCDDCPVDFSNHQFTLCKQSFHSDKSCVGDWIGGRGDWCFKVGLSGSDRMKVCHLKSTPSFETNILIHHSGQSFHQGFYGYITENVDQTGLVNITFTESSVTQYTTPEFIIYDRLHNSNIYALGSTDVNGLSESDPSKFGWFKSSLDTKVFGDISEKLNVRLKNCLHDSFHVEFPWTASDQFLNNRKGDLLQSLIPGSIVFDDDRSDTTLYSSDPIHSNRKYQYGVTFIDSYGIRSFGKYNDGNFNPSFPSSFLNTSSGVSNPCVDSTQGVLCGVYGAFYSIGSVDNVGNPIQIGLLEVDHDNMTVYNDTKPLALCTKFESTPAFNCKWFNQSQTPLTVNLYPSQYKAELRFGEGGFIFNYSHVNLPMNVFIPPLSSVLNMAVQFKNLTIKFEHTTVKPQIINVVINNTMLQLTAKSLTVPGQCYVSTLPPNLFPPYSIFLTLNPLEFPISFTAPEYAGNISVIINCYDKTVNKQLQVNFNNSQLEDNLEQGDTLGSASDSFNPFNLGDLLDGLGSLDLPWHGWLALIFYFVLGVIVLIILVIIISFIIKFLLSRLSFPKLFKRKSPDINPSKSPLEAKTIEKSKNMESKVSKLARELVNAAKKQK